MVKHRRLRPRVSVGVKHVTGVVIGQQKEQIRLSVLGRATVPRALKANAPDAAPASPPKNFLRVGIDESPTCLRALSVSLKLHGVSNNCAVCRVGHFNVIGVSGGPQ